MNTPSPEAHQRLQTEIEAAHQELEAIARYIRQAKSEIAAIQPADISTTHIPDATDELGAVVGATEDATNRIMDVCDDISVLSTQCPPEVAAKLVACTTRIFEACNFQDVTGQRIAKVVTTLKYIDARIGAIAEALGEEIHSLAQSRRVNPVEIAPAANPEETLLNGPQLPANAISQDDIDRLISGT